MKRLQVYPTSGITVTFDPNVCVHSGVCIRTLPAVFDVRRSPWIATDQAGADDMAAAIDRCPSGALQYYRNVESDPAVKNRLMKAVTINRVEILASSQAPRANRAETIAATIQEARGYSWVGIYDVGDDEITAIAWTGEAPAHPRFPRTSGLNGAAVAGRKTVVVNDVTADARYLETHGSTRSELVTPVFNGAGENIIATIDVASDRADAFGPDDIDLLEACAAAVWRAWDSA
jgi:putative methionine-R-sulfoxide reductase with GAF domain